MRGDFSRLAPEEGAIAELQLLLARRRDLIIDKTRAVTRLRESLVSLFPALECALDLNAKGPLVLLSRYQSPGKIRRVGHKRLAAHLNRQGVKGAEELAKKALAAARTQNVELPAQEVASRICAEIAREVLALKERLCALDGEIASRFFARPEAPILASLPGMGPLLGSEFLVACGDLAVFESADQLAAYVGLVPAARDSGKRVGNHRRMRGGNKVLKRVFFLSAFASLLRCSPHSRAFYDRKRKEGKRHTQVLIALARRRVNVLWAMLRDETTFKVPPAFRKNRKTASLRLAGGWCLASSLPIAYGRQAEGSWCWL
jgi:transposase